MHRACEQATLCNGGFGAYDFCLFIKCEDIVFLFKDSKKLLSTLCYGKCVKIGIVSFSENGADDFVSENNLMIQAAAVDRRTGKPRLEESDRLSLITPLNFNASIRRYINALYAGCNLHIVPYSIIKNPPQLRQYILDNRITVMCASPSLLRMIQDPGPYVRQIQISSEPANGLFFEGPELVNAYAMSESGFPVTEFIIDKLYDECPVGRPNVEQIHVRVVDEEGKEVPPGSGWRLPYGRYRKETGR